MYYIQECDKLNFIFKFFDIIKLEDDKIILPIDKNEIKEKNANRLAIKVKKILDKTSCKKVVVSNQIHNHENFINFLNMYDFNIVDGKWLFELLSNEVLEYIIKKKEMKKEELQISILVNDLSENMLENIKIIVKQYKVVNIVTNHMEKFKKIEKQILENEGIMITINNNKRKSLLKSNIILNVDFPTELINKYNIYDEAIIVNIKKDVKINKKRFNGINVNDFNIEFENIDEFDYEKENKYKSIEIYESQIYQKQTYEDIMKKIKKDKLKIIGLKANNIVI